MAVITLSPTGSAATDTANLQNAYTTAASSSRAVTGISDPCGTVTIQFAAGTFFINAAQAMMASATPTGKITGLVFEGAGSDLTVISYTPATSGPLCLNERWLNIRWRGITFVGNDANSDFLDSAEQGGVTNIQYFDFEDVSWGGSWKYINMLTGGNNNSEWSYRRCTCSPAVLTAFTFVPSTGGSDQFLNFWFHQFKFDAGSGSWLDMALGGSVGITDCDVSGWSPSTTTYLFNLRGSAHARGVCTFKVDKLRIEHHTDFALLLQSAWNYGNISFNQLDQSSQVGSRSAANVYCSFNISNNAGPNVTFSNSQLIGKHGYTTSTNNFKIGNSIVYENCALLQNNDAANFITWTNGGNSGGAPVIHFNHMLNPGAAAPFKYISDTDLFWDKGSGAVTKTRTVQLVAANSDGPLSSNMQWRFPLNAVITRIRMFKAAGSNSGAYSYLLQDTSATPKVLMNWTGPAANAAINTDTDAAAGFVGTASASGAILTVTAVQAGQVMVGSLLTGASVPVGTFVTQQMTGTGGTGTYQISTSAGFVSQTVRVDRPFIPLTADATRTLELLDAASRTSGFTGFYLLVDYLG